MNTLSKTYEPKSVETPIYKRWEKSGYFNPDKLPNAKKRKPYSIAMPPPNVTGELHIGHALDLTTQDILIRWKRMDGFAALWTPGTDHAGIATQILVERALRDNGISRHQIGRKKFLEHVWQWKERYGERIIEQVRRIGASCDWSREHFTMDPTLTAAVQKAFMTLYGDGLIYRGERVIHWCPDDQTGISDLEVDYQEEPGTLWYLRYPVVDEQAFIMVATTRPETMLGDTAVAVNPKDERYRNLIGKRVRLPITHRIVPVIADRTVDSSFGTGAVKVTPAHDAADFEMGQRHNLPSISVIDRFGKMTLEAGNDFQGLSVTEARGLVLQLLQEANVLDHEERITHSVAYCSRSHTVIEPLLSKQWFVKTKPMAALALKALKKGDIRVVPERFTKVLVSWLTNIRDWNISRQLWWGHRIPIWYCIACDEPIASITEPKAKCKKCGNRAFRQDEGTLDTWFSSGLWTFSTLGWPASVNTPAGHVQTPSAFYVAGKPKKGSDLERFHPTSVLGTGWDILFFWVARMSMMSTYLLKKVPFKTIYLHGLVLNEQGKKMSKSKGTGVDPLPMSEKYGTDALRLSLVVGTAPGLDFRMTEAKISGQRNFCNKLWNVSRYVLSQAPPKSYKLPAKSYSLADRWILARLNETTSLVTNHLDQFQFSLAVEALQQFLWKDLADWYVEVHKVEKNTALLRHALRQYLILLHPFAPFITEAIWSTMGEKKLLMIEPWPKPKKATAADKRSTSDFKKFQQLVIGLRNLRLRGNDNKPLEVAAKLDGAELIARLTNISFGNVTGAGLAVSGTTITVPKDVAVKFIAWRERERSQLESYIANKEKLAGNEKAPAQVREQAKADLMLANERLAEL